MKVGEHFEALWKAAFAEMPEEISSRGHVYRCADLYTQHHLFKVDEVKRVMEENPEIKWQTYNAAAQLLRWRCPQYTVKEKRVILDSSKNHWPPVAKRGDLVEHEIQDLLDS